MSQRTLSPTPIVMFGGVNAPPAIETVTVVGAPEGVGVAVGAGGVVGVAVGAGGVVGVAVGTGGVVGVAVAPGGWVGVAVGAGGGAGVAVEVGVAVAGGGVPPTTTVPSSPWSMQ